MDDTRTATLSLHQSAQGPQLGLEVAWHPDPAFIGSVRSVVAGERLELGRGSSELGGAFRDPRISRRHAVLGRLGSALSVRDQGSHNGTWVNGERVQSAPLQIGDVLGLGQVLLVVRRLPDGPAPRDPEPGIQGHSLPLQEALKAVDQVAPTELPVLLIGESGTGKELLARRVHERSGRRGEFVAVNCAGVADTLLQSELFGHVKGAYSGAERARRGLVDQARGGTLLLDEIGDASLSLQAALLRLLQEGELRPVGADRSVKVDLRFVAATNRDLAVEVRAGRFREDLYARLNRLPIHLSPLRERREDILPLARSLLAPQRLSHPLAQALLLHDWPGNARAVQAVTEQLRLRLPEESVLPLPEWLPRVLAQQARAEPEAPSEPTLTAPQPAALPSGPTLSELSPQALESLLREHGANLSAVAKALGVGRNTLYRHIQRLGLDLEALRAELGDGRRR